MGFRGSGLVVKKMATTTIMGLYKVSGFGLRVQSLGSRVV